MDTRRLFVYLFVVALFTMAVRETLDPDMWWHLRTGELILQDGIPRQDVFSFTVPDHRWITHEWLSQVVMWLVYGIGQLPGLILVFAAVITGAFVLVYWRSPGRPYLAAFVVLLAALASALTWGARPQMFNVLFLAAFVYIVEGVKDDRLGRRALWLLPLLTVAWVNLHSGYLLGTVLLAGYVVGDTIQLQFEPRLGDTPARTVSWANIRLLALVTLVSFAAALLNPNGYHLWIYPFETLGSSAMQSYIQEWHPPDFHLPMFWPFALLLVLGVLGWIVQPGRPPVTDVMLFLGTGAAGLLSARHIPLFAVVAAPIVARTWAQVLGQTRARFLIMPTQIPHPPRAQRLLNWFVLALALLAMILWSGSKIAANEDAIARRYPVAAIDFLEVEGLADERGYNSYGWGGYLIWRGIPVYVDGRADVYGDEFLYFYLQTLELQESWREPLTTFDVSYVLLHQGSGLTTLLAVSDDWREVYADGLAQIFVWDK
jgi:hypothetical protein